MTNKKTETKGALEKEQKKLHAEISSAKKSMRDYKDERKDNWKEFKNKIKDDIDKIEKSVDKLTAPKKKKINEKN